MQPKTRQPDQPTSYVHDSGPVVISQGIGHSKWGAFIRRPNGTLKRFTPIQMCDKPDHVRAMLYQYKGRAVRMQSSSLNYDHH